MADHDKNVDDAVGKAKEGIGKATGDESMRTDGLKDQAKSQVKDAADKAKDAADTAKDKAKETASEAINKIRDAKR